MSLEPTTNFRDSNGVDLGSKLVTKDYLISVYPSIGQQIGIPPELWVWGNGLSGQLGNFSTTNRSTPVTTTSGGSNWKQVSAGFAHSGAIKTDGTLWTWGNGNYGCLGNNSATNISTPVTTSIGGTDWKQVNVGSSSTFAIKTDGTLWTWGNNTNGQLGKGGQNILYTIASTPVLVFGGGVNWADTPTTNAEDLYTISAGTIYTTALKTDGTLWIWGNNTFGQIGTNDTITKSTPVTTFTGGTNWKQVDASETHTTAIKTDGTLWVWGNNGNGQLGVILNAISTPVTTFAGGTDWADTPTTNAEDLYTIDAGVNQTAAIKTDGTLWVWGSNTTGEVGTNNLTTQSTPVTTFAGGTNWKQVSAGGFHTSAIKTDGTLWTWGFNASGMLGINDTTNRSTPVTTFAGGTDWRQVATGSSFAIATKTDGTLWSWGQTGSAQLGRLSGLAFRMTPVTTFAGGNNWADTVTAAPEELYTISAGSGFSTAIKTDGTLWTWGNSINGQLGTNDTLVRSTPVTTFAGGTNWKQVYAGTTHLAAIKTDGTLWTWGSGGNAKLGINNISSRSTPVTTFAGGTDWKQVSANDDHSAAIKTDGTLWTWGNGGSGRLGTSDITNRSTPVTTFAGGTDWKQISVGGAHSAAIKTDGTLWTWGSANVGGLGNAVSLASTRSTPVTTRSGGTDWKQVSCGGAVTAAIKTDGTLWTWGSGLDGKLGNNSLTDRSTPITTFAGGTDWKQVMIGDDHTAAIKTDGTLWVWGEGDFGQLGSNDTIEKLTPVTTFAGGTNWTQVSVGANYTIALKETNELYVFGNNSTQQLGINYNLSIPEKADGTNWNHVSAGTNHVAAVKTDGTLWTWGNAINGQLGTNDTLVRSTPVTTFVGGTDWKQAATGYRFTTAIKTDGTLWTWGNGISGQLGNFDTTNRSTPSTTFAGGTNWKQVSCGSASTTNQHMAAIKTDGTLWTWGNGVFGSLGNNDTSIRSTPVTTFAGGTNWTQVSVGTNYTIALKDTAGNKELYVFGNNQNLALGFNTTTFNTFPIQPEGNSADWKQVSAGRRHTAAIKTDGTLWTWGNGLSGQLGDSSIVSKLTPVTTRSGGTDWKQVSAGDLHTIAIKTDGTLWTWGSNTSGRLGNGLTSLTRSTPITTFAGGTDWKQLSTGAAHSAAIKTDGTLWTWGFGSSGQLGDSSIVSKSTPVTTRSGGTDWKQVSTGGYHTTAIKTDGTLWTWGRGDNGQLGNNSITNRSTPVTTRSGGTNWKQVEAGSNHTAALTDDGVNKRLYVFGNNADGILGSNVNPAENYIPLQIFGNTSDWKQVSPGSQHTSAVKTDGTLWIWGNSDAGRLGNAGVFFIRSTPITTFAGGTDWKQVSAGNDHTAAIKTDGTLWSWGRTTGIQSVFIRSTPITTFVGGTNWKQVSAANGTTSAIKTDGTLWSWGYLGAPGRAYVNEYSYTPVTTLFGGTNWKNTDTEEAEELYTVSAGYYETAAIKTDGTLWTWGKLSEELGRYTVGSSFIERSRLTPSTTFAGGTNWKQVSLSRGILSAIKTDGTLWLSGGSGLGDFTDSSTSTPVTTFAGGNDWKQVSVSRGARAAIKTDGTLWTWGFNFSAQLGTNDAIERSTPVTTFAGGNDWKHVSAGRRSVAAIKTDGTLWVWGGGGYGQLGTNDTINKSTPVTTFAGGTDWKQISVGHLIGVTSAAIKTDGTLWTWGQGLGLGNNTNSAALTPVTTFAGGTNWKQVQVGYYHTSAIKTNGTLWTWGYGSNGLAVNDVNSRSTPVTTFAGGTNWTQVSSGGYHSVAIKNNGTLWTWGSNIYSQLGFVWNDTVLVPEKINNFTDWKQVNSSYDHVAAIKTDGTLWAWGNAYNGRLGNNLISNTIIVTPVTTRLGGTDWKQVSSGGSHTLAIRSVNF